MGLSPTAEQSQGLLVPDWHWVNGTQGVELASTAEGWWCCSQVAAEPAVKVEVLRTKVEITLVKVGALSGTFVQLLLPCGLRASAAGAGVLGPQLLACGLRARAAVSVSSQWTPVRAAVDARRYF